MAILGDAVATVRAAEAALKELVARAAAEGQYDAVRTLAGWASALNDMARSAEPPMPASGPVPASTPRGKATRAGPKNYPQFRRCGDDLIKVGWSKKEKATYEHRAPRAVVAGLAEAVQRAGAGRRRFTTEALFPLTNPDGSVVPAYQGYLALAWLRKEGLVEEGGRGSYGLKAGVDLGRAWGERWAALVEA